MLVANDTTTTLPEIQAASIFLPPSLFAELENTTKVGIGFTFYETAALFPLPDGSPSNLTIASAVIGALVAGQNFFNLPEPVNISLHLTIPVCSYICLLVFVCTKVTLFSLFVQIRNPQCASWNFTAAGKVQSHHAISVTTFVLLIFTTNHILQFMVCHPSLNFRWSWKLDH